jgi:hypothetical protein
VVEIRRLGESSGGLQTLVDEIEMFSDWSGMEVKIVKSSGMWVGLRNIRKKLILFTESIQVEVIFKFWDYLKNELIYS